MPAARRDALPPGDAGLTTGEAAARRARFGPNEILERAVPAWRALLVETASDPMIGFLVATSGVYFALGQQAEGWVLLGSTAPLAAMDAWLHHRVAASTRGLGSRLATRARARRDGRDVEVPVVEVVPGDLVTVRAGEAFPADGFVVEAREAQVDESALTGESVPVRKRPATGVRPDVAIAPASWVSAGTRLLTGEVRARVIYTAGETVYGAIVHAARAAGPSRTPLQVAVGKLVGVLVGLAAVLCVVLAAARLAQGHGLLDALVSAATLAVAALPEEFPVAVAVFLGVGVARLARRKAWVRRAVAVETIGRVTAICTDKTGTLTEGRLRLAHALPAGDLTEARLLALAAAACRREAGDPLDDAVLDAAGVDEPPAVATFPFTEVRRRETRIVRDEGGLLAVTKGAPETIDACCGGAPAAHAESLAGTGHKVVAVATRRVEATDVEPAEGFRPAGLLAFEDPIRPGVADAVAACRAAGIRVLMITGDHPATAAEIARTLRLGGGRPRVIVGEEATGDLDGVDVVARAMPEHKLRIVQALRARGEIVAVTGDGVNDVPALQAADVGIAMGERGTRSAREAAAIVLADDDFGTLVAAIREGRQLFRNLRRSFEYLLIVHLPLFASATVLPLLGWPLVYEPAHIVWLEAMIHPSAMLAFQDAAPPGPLAEAPPRGPVRFFDGRTWVTVAVAAAALTAVVTWSWLRGVSDPTHEAHARALAMAAMATGSATVTTLLSGLRTRAARAVVAATLGGSIVLLYVPAIARALHMWPPHPADWLLVCGAAVLAAALPLTIARRPARAQPPGASLGRQTVENQ